MSVFVGSTGRDAFDANEAGARRAVLVADGYVDLDAGKFDALIVEGVEYGAAGVALTVAVPYRPAAGSGRRSGPASTLTPRRPWSGMSTSTIRSDPAAESGQGAKAGV
ncbi:hypothetical protein [Dactylosporangium sp. NPDC051541]|uniref:hypothetical protein n=1 Tax=Dactylosporangium sp. NPDC051541 TaxID=3363977 RepID=UPI0037AC3795